MAVVFVIIGLALIISAIRNTWSTPSTGLQALLVSDFTSSANGSVPFGIWILAIFSIGALGYIPGFRTLSNGLLVLVIIVLLLSNSGFFGKFQKAVGQ